MKNERLSKMLENAEIKLLKLNKSLDRLNKQLIKEQAVNEYTRSTEDDIRRRTRDITDIKKSIDEYKEKLKAIQSIEEIPVLREFINNWKSKASDYYIKQYNKLIEYQEFLEKQQEIFENWIEETTGHKYFGSYSNSKEITEKRKELKIDRETKNEYLKKNFDSIIILNIGMHNNDWQQAIEKIVNNEAERKYISFLNRIKKAVGKTIDCKGLKIGYNAEINGIVKGELGNAKVETISAGGYNIQCWHFRILVNLIKGN